jgi:hypothetical protein
MPDRLRRNCSEQETRLVIGARRRPQARLKTNGMTTLTTADLRQKDAPHIFAMYQLDTSS